MLQEFIVHAPPPLELDILCFELSLDFELMTFQNFHFFLTFFGNGFFSIRVPSRTRPRTLSGSILGAENNFIQIKEKNMYYYQILKNQ